MAASHSTLPPSIRLYGILDTLYVSRERWQPLARAMADGGVGMVEIRAKGETTPTLIELARQVEPLFRERDIPMVINDDAEAALAGDNWGLHIGQDDGDPVSYRKRLGPDRILGLSTHSLAQAQAAMALPSGTLSYFAVGPVYATETKPDYPAVGLGLVEAVARMHPALPWFAIGGVNRQTLPAVLQSGATRVVVVSDILCDPDPAAASRRMAQMLP